MQGKMYLRKFMVILMPLILVGMYYLPEFNRPDVDVARARNIVIISLDTLRADRLGTYGYQRDTSPALDRFANGGVVFDKAVSPAPWTLPTHVSLFTGLFPSSHGVTKSAHQRIPQSISLLAETLQSSGFRTHAITGGGYLSESYGFDRGFSTFEKLRRGFEGTTATMVEKAKELIKEYQTSGERYFLFLHTYDIHCPYAPPEPYYSMFKSDGAEYIDTARCAKYYIKNPVSLAQAQFISDRYDGSIRWVDDKLEDFFAFLQKRNAFDDTLIVVLSDHGEEFLEHGNIGHSGSLHKELLSVPLIIVGAGLSPQRITSPVSLVDIRPTVLSLLGLREDSNNRTDGISLTSHLLYQKDEKIRPFQFAELDRERILRARVGNRTQLILDLEKGAYEFINFESGTEKVGSFENITCKKISDRYSALQTFMSELGVSPQGESVNQSNEQLNQLRTLGYL